MATIFAWTGALRKRGQLDGLTELEQFADKVLLLNKKILKSGPPEEVLSSPEFYETFHLRVGKGGEH